MNSELVIRPGASDQQVIAELLSPGPGSTLPIWGPPISRLVVDAHLAAKMPMVGDAAAAVGIPYLIDPNTHLLQTDLRATDSWAKLPFGSVRALEGKDLATDQSKHDLIDRVVTFELETGSTAVIAPYLYASEPSDPWFETSLDLLTRTATHMQDAGIHVPLIAVLCAQLQSFGSEKNANAGLDRFIDTAVKSGAASVAVCLTPSGSQRDGYHKVLGLFRAFQRLQAGPIPVFAWRQGIYGRALVAAGARGYETGIGTNEQSNILGSMANRRPSPDGTKRSGAAAPGIFVEPLGRSISAPVATALFRNLRMRAKIMCDDESCCPLGVRSTLENHRQHAVRARARALNALDEMPKGSWRLHRVAQDARGTETLVDQANRVLHAERVDATLHGNYAGSIARVAEFLLGHASRTTAPP